MRHAAAAYLSLSPDKVEISRTALGKPLLKKAADLQVNLAHASGAVIVGFTRTHPIGVDLESAAQADLCSVEEAACTKVEQAFLSSLRGEGRKKHFLRLWTRKEALLKAAGFGLCVQPKLLNIGIEKETLLSGPQHSYCKEFMGMKYELADLRLGCPWVGSVAVKNGLFAVKYFSLGWPAIIHDTDSIGKTHMAHP
jgi:phosphopantetheinyl transferase